MMNNWYQATISGYPSRVGAITWGGRHPFGGMMGYAYPGNNGLFVVTAVLHVITWVLLLVLLVAVIRYIWKKGGK